MMKTEVILEITRCPSGESQWFIKKEVPIGMVIPNGVNLVLDNIHMHVYDVTYKIPESEQIILTHTHCDDDNYEEIIECMLHHGWVIHEHAIFPTWEDAQDEEG